jgi:hypothetical protein
VGFVWGSGETHQRVLAAGMRHAVVCMSNEEATKKCLDKVILGLPGMNDSNGKEWNGMERRTAHSCPRLFPSLQSVSFKVDDHRSTSH